MTLSVLIVGLDPSLAAHARSSRATFPDLDADAVAAGIEENRAALGRRGLETDFCGIDHGATAEATFRAALGRRPYDIVVTGAGVRLDLALTHLLEVLVNLTHELAPQATIVFNTGETTVKGRNLRRTGYATLSVDDDEAPFSFVTLEGPVTVSDDLADVRHWAGVIGGRYMGADRADEYGDRNGVPGELLVRLTPAKVVSAFGVAD